MNKREYLASLGVGITLTFIFDEVLWSIYMYAGERRIFGGGWALFFTIMNLIYPFNYLFKFYLKSSFIGIPPILLFTLAIAYFLSEKLRLKFFLPLLISSGIVYMLPVAFITSGRGDIPWWGYTLFWIFWAIRATVLSSLVYLVVKRAGGIR
jgi:glucose-6-phosphate-specific signal transduction histidine kinase